MKNRQSRNAEGARSARKRSGTKNGRLRKNRDFSVWALESGGRSRPPTEGERRLFNERRVSQVTGQRGGGSTLPVVFCRPFLLADSRRSRFQRYWRWLSFW